VCSTVSVGNLAMGGRGKTPVVAYLARLLIAAGERPAILSRGYGRRYIEDGVVIVSDGTHLLADVDRAGDEPLMLARAVPGAAVLVCEQRALAGALATRALGATVLLLDDGFQHRAMRRDLDIVIVAASDFRARRFPLGPLREPVGALRRAHAILIDGEIGGAERESLPVPAFDLRRGTGVPVALEPAHPVPGPGSRVVALAAIAGPDRFTRALESAGWQVVRTLAHRDHYRFTEEDLAEAALAVRDLGAAGLLTTEKDAMRLLPLRPFPVPIAAVPLQVSIEPPAAFERWFAGRLQEIRA
jgi:tetraacyldisaccharide 4'-kinase